MDAKIRGLRTTAKAEQRDAHLVNVFSTTMPSILRGCFAASHIATAPPMECPNATMGGRRSDLDMSFRRIIR